MTHLPDDRYVLFRRQWNPQRNKFDKFPCNASGAVIDAQDSTQWMSRAEAERHATWDESRAAAPYGVGIVLNGDGWWCIDIDNCRAEDGQWTAESAAIFQSFGGALGEVSTSGMGLHVLGRADVSQLADLRNKWDGNKEFYTDKRFVALSRAGPQPIGGEWTDKDWTHQLRATVPHRQFLCELPDGIDPAYTGPASDDDLIPMMLGSTNTAGAFGRGVSFADLWKGNEAALGSKYPDPVRAFDASAADMALMAHLAFWTGRDMPRMDRLFRRSMLMRDKYEKRADYRRETIRKAARMTKNVYDRAPRNTSDLSECHADMSHDDLARHIYAQRWAGNMLHVPEHDRWAEWNGKRWQLARTDKEQITRLRQDLRDVPGAEDAAKRRRLGDAKTIMAVNALMKTNEGAARNLDAWDADPFILGTPTQIVDLRTGEVRPRAATDYLLRSTRYDPAPPEAIPALWLAFLETVTGGDIELQDFLQRLSGYAATGSTKEHKMFFAYGTGRNGKSTWLNTLDAILSEDYAKVISPRLLLDKKTEQHATDLAHLAQARLARASELPVGKVWDEALLKQITGGDRITARFMRQNNFTFTPRCTLIVDANNAPSIRGIDEAFRRRMCVIPFDTTISKEAVDPDLPEKLLREGPSILRWMIDGAVEWCENGLAIPHRIESATQDYLDAEDTFGAFLREHFDNTPDDRVTNSQLHIMFQDHMQKMGLPGWAPTTISKEVRKRGYITFKSGDVRGFRGISVKKATLAVVPR